MPKRCWIFLLLAVMGGCGPPVYRVRTTVPWPDEWKAGPRRPDRIDLPMSVDTMAWHRGTDRATLRRRVERIVAAYPDAMILSRTGFADLLGKARNPASAFAFLEVRVTACPIPVSRETRRFKWNINQVSLEQVLERFSIGIGQQIRLAHNVDGSMPVTFHADELGAAEALACILLRNNLYLTPTCLGTSVLRSYEYANRDLFLRAIQSRATQATRARPKGPYQVITLEEWTRRHQALLARLDLWDEPGQGPSADAPQNSTHPDTLAAADPFGDLAGASSVAVARAHRAGRYLTRLIEMRLAGTARTTR